MSLLELERQMPRGTWLKTGDGGHRFMLDVARRRWAATTEAEALASFVARKRWQAFILRARDERGPATAEAGLLGVDVGPRELVGDGGLPQAPARQRVE